MSRNRVWCEFKEGKPIRIFRSSGAAVVSDAWNEGRVRECPRRNAVEMIRFQVYEAGKGVCPFCGQNVSWAGWDKGDMHEVIPRGKGGEVSIFNSVYVCRSCHSREHAKRNPQWAKKERSSEQ